MDKLADRIFVVLIGWWFVPAFAFLCWLRGLGNDPPRLTLRQDMRIALDVLRDEWKGDRP